jgi:amino acid permease
MEPISKWWFGFLCFCIYVPLCWVRKVEKLAATHLFGDIMIIFTVITIFVYAGIAVG